MAQPQDELPTPTAPPAQLMARPDGVSPEQWDARVQTAQLTLVRVLLRVRERLIAEGKLKPQR
jgi:hypothetical protein